MNDITYEEIGEWVATTQSGDEVYGQTRQECEERRREANRAYAQHCRANPGAYWEVRSNKCFLCDALIADDAALCPACQREQEAQARDWRGDAAHQRYPALA